MEAWPKLATPGWEETAYVLLRQAQLVGKTTLALSPPVNHWWHVTLRVTARGLSTGLLHAPSADLELALDFREHALVAVTSDGLREELPLDLGSVAAFHRGYLEFLDALGVSVRIWPHPVEVPEPALAFDRDLEPRRYDRAWAEAHHAALRQAHRLLERFRGGFVGKASPVHWFWGSFDLASTRFSGRRAPLHPGGVPSLSDLVVREAYSHEVWSAGFWPGGPAYQEAAFYAYAYPEPEGFARAKVAPAAARYEPSLREFVLPYEDVRASRDPDGDVLSFLASTYEAAAELGWWDRARLERQPPRPSPGEPAPVHRG